MQNKQFFLAESAPICNGELRDQFGYCADMDQANTILDGEYMAVEKVDNATVELFGEIGRIKAAKGNETTKDTITGEEWSKGWRRKKEETSSSKSGLHFGHYRLGLFSTMISHLHAMKASVAFKKGVPMERWKSGLAVMQEKQANCTLVEKLRSILLMEADFIFCNMIIIMGK
jgi:hypothetical protein